MSGGLAALGAPVGQPHPKWGMSWALPARMIRPWSNTMTWSSLAPARAGEPSRTRVRFSAARI